MKPPKQDFDQDKFKRAIHYIVWKAGSHKGFGATKLNKVLWFSDARMYVLHKQSITGATYVRQTHGPVPKQFVSCRDAMERAGIIEKWTDVKERQTHFRTHTVPDMSAFSEEEKRLLDHWITIIDRDHTAASISDKTHDYGWEIARQGEEIPLFAILAERVRHPKGDELEWARKEAERLGLP